MSGNAKTVLLVISSAVCGAVAFAGISKLIEKKKKNKDPEIDYSVAHELVWKCIGGGMGASMLYIGDRLKLYETLRVMCQKDGSYVTAIQLAQDTGLNQRWLREWMAQQAALGVLILKPDPNNSDDDASLKYRLPKATATVLADSSSKEYDIAMVSCVPSLVNRAKTMLPEAFKTGIGRPYDEPDVADGIDRQHRVHIRDVFFPEVVPKAGNALQLLERGCIVADLGCGGGNLVIAMAKRFPKSTFHGYEVSTQALSQAAANLAKNKLSNVFLHDANDEKESLGYQENRFDVVTTYDVLHDAPFPADLIKQVRRGLKPDGGIWLLADIPSQPTIRENIKQNPGAHTYFAISTCLCMSCSLSAPGGAGLGTLGFTIPVAKKMLKEGGFDSVKVITENSSARWFAVS